MRENLIDAAIREVQEETNIRTKFESLVSGKLRRIATNPLTHFGV